MQVRQKSVVAGLALVFVGLFLLIGNLTSLAGWTFILGLGAVFLASYAWTSRYGLLIPGCILAAIGVFAAIEDQGLLSGSGTAWFLVALGLGFLTIYALGRRWQSRWSLVVGCILVVSGATVALFSAVTLPELEQMKQVVRWWPAMLILFGLWILVSRYLTSSVRLIGGLMLGLLTVSFALSAVAVGLAANGDFADGWKLLTLGRRLEVEETVERTATLPVGGKLVVQNRSGSTTIRRGEGRDVKVVATKHVWTWSEEQGRRDLESVVVDVVERGQNVEISWRRSSPAGTSSSFSGKVDYEITLPADAAVEADTSSGNVVVREINGNVKVQVSSGSVDLTAIGSSADVNTRSGNVRLESMAGPVKATVSSGRIVVNGLGSTFRLETRSGGVEVAGEIRSSGQITTTSGSVRLEPGKDSAFRLDAKTKSGAISVDSLYSVERKTKNEQLVAVGGGGPDVRVRVSSGNIVLR